MDIDLDEFDRLLEGIDAAEPAVRAAAAGRLEAIYALHCVLPTGRYSADNLHCLCRRHHRIKHQTGWQVTNIGDNELEWTSPAGRTYRTNHPFTLDHTA